MTASTQILQFDSLLTNLQPLANYSGSAIQTGGFQAGLVDPTVLNIILHQASFVACGIANFCVAQGISVPDDGNISNFITELEGAISNFITSGGTGPVNYVQIYNGNPNGHVAGSVGTAGTISPSMVWDTAENTLWVCTTSGTTSTAVWSRQSIMQVYSGNPNGHVAGVAGTAGSSSPSFCWDPTNTILWVCTTSGTTSTAVWTEIGDNTAWPFWCGTSTGSANAQTVTPPSAMQTMPTGTTIVFDAGYTNTSALAITVGSFGTFQTRKDGPTGPIALTGGEVVAGNTPTFRFDGTYLHLVATELGTAALKNTGNSVKDPGTGSLEVFFPGSSTTGASLAYTSSNQAYTVKRSNSGSAMTDTLPSGAQNGWNMTIMNVDATGTLTVSAPGGVKLNNVLAGSFQLLGGSQVSAYIEADENGNLWATILGTASTQQASSNTGVVASVSSTIPITLGHLAVFTDTKGTIGDGGNPLIAAGGLVVNSSQAVQPGTYWVDTSGGPITLTLSASLTGAYTFIDASNTWATNNLTINGNGNNIGNTSSNTAATFIANVSDAEFSLRSTATYWRLV